VVGLACGLGSALFLFLLSLATATRERTGALVYALPLAGAALGWTFQRFGAAIRPGNDLVIDTIHDGGPRIPLRMAPMVVGGTIVTHLFGGSAGREGTAVQMGASLADDLAHRLGVRPQIRRQLLAAGVAGGFGSVFGTPIAGTVFGLEFVVVGRLEYGALLPALVAALVGDLTTRALGIGHDPYPAAPALPLDLLVVGKWVLFAAAIALAAAVFVDLTHAIKRLLARRVPSLPLRLALGGVAIVALAELAGTRAYLGLGLPLIEQAFHDPALPAGAFVGKLVFTVVTLGAGFVGGEVTPLFGIGATLGNVLARLLDLPLVLGAGVGLAALFAAAANAPLALSVMAVELFGAHVLPHVVVVSVVAYLLTGHRSIYSAQRLIGEKRLEGPRTTPAPATPAWGEEKNP
jgi:H+/Cl- antiporter ClcA